MRCIAKVKSERKGNAELINATTRRTLTRTKAPIFRRRKRMVPQVALASSVPAGA